MLVKHAGPLWELHLWDLLLSSTDLVPVPSHPRQSDEPFVCSDTQGPFCHLCPYGASEVIQQPAIPNLAPSTRVIEIQSTDQIIGSSPKKEALGSCVTNQSGPFKQRTRLEQAPEQTRAENLQLSKAGF